MHINQLMAKPTVQNRGKTGHILSLIEGCESSGRMVSKLSFLSLDNDSSKTLTQLEISVYSPLILYILFTYYLVRFWNSKFM